VVLSLAVIGIVVLLNLFAARYYKRFDVTQSRLHSLSPQSLQVLGDLEAGIEIIGFYPNRQGQEDFETWLDEYRAHTDALDYRVIDPIRQPGETERLGWDAYGPGLLVRRGNRSQEVFYPDEQDITSALLKVSKASPKVVYFLSGHKERAPFDATGAGYADLAAFLELNNYEIRSLNLSVAEDVPDDAALLIIAGPRTPLLEGEQERLQTYLAAEGKALILVDPPLGDSPEAETDVAYLRDINSLLEPWQIRFADEVVVDLEQSLGGDPLTPVLTEYGFHHITKDLGNTLIALPLAAPILLPDAPAWDTLVSYEVLAMTSEASWGERDVQREPLQYDEGTDTPGPLAVVLTVNGAAREGEGTSTRLVLIGDSDLARNDVLAQIPNGQYLLLNAVNWLAEDEALIAIGPKTGMQTPGQQSTIRLSQRQETVISIVVLILIPAAIVLAGFIVWARRRRRPARSDDL
jgi:ABC-type uncharacterized transport system involved in gliding motility auxiliary subunit